MHILVSNDDGPPSPQSSPYVHSLVRELQKAGHVVSVCLPHTQRSWIGKAHMIGQTVKPRYYRPPPPSAPAAGSIVGREGPEHVGTIHPRPLKSRVGSNASGQNGVAEEEEEEEWILVDGTPASCVQIGLHHCFRDRGPIDLVVCGPNYGRNTTAVFALSSGTLGGALEAASCRHRSIALSYAFFTRNHDPAIIAAASRHSVRVIEALARDWPADGSVDVYSVNVPLVEGVEEHKTLWTGMLQNYWGEGGSCFEEVEGSVDGEAEEEERIREEGEVGPGESKGQKPKERKHMHFKWAPRFTDVYKSVEDAPPGNDGWAVKEGYTSVTPLKANFWQAATYLHQQELKLEPIGTDQGSSHLAMRPKEKPESSANAPLFYALVAYEDEYVQPLLLTAFQAHFPEGQYRFLNLPTKRGSGADATAPDVSLAQIVPKPDAKVIQIMPYESIDFEYAASHPSTVLVNSYMIRKALIRKHYLSATMEHWVAKHPDSVLKRHIKRSEAFEVDYAEFLDDALVEAFDLRASLEQNETGAEGAAPKNPKDKEWWILKPGMSDRGQGIRLFSTMEALQAIFDQWEAEEPDTDDEGEAGSEAGGEQGRRDAEERDYITTSHLRHFVAQPYIHPPLLVPGDDRKFHIRTYVLAVGSMRVYVYREMLALFAAKPYSPPWITTTGGDGDGPDLDAHLTNTCLQDPDASERDATVKPFWSLPLAPGVREAVFDQICAVTGEVFEAAARGMLVHFQPLPGAFEAYGLDFLVDAREGGCGRPWLLEVNAFPDFRQTGPGLQGIVARFWSGVVRRAVVPFVGAETGGGTDDVDDGMVLVREVDLGRRG